MKTNSINHVSKVTLPCLLKGQKIVHKIPIIVFKGGLDC